MRRIELRCVAETGFERNILLAGKLMSVAYSRGAVQFELEQVLLMLFNCIVVFHHSLPRSLLLPSVPGTAHPGGLLTSKWSCKGILMGHGRSVALRLMLELNLAHAQRHICTCFSLSVSPGAESNDVRSVGLAATAPVQGEMCLMSDFAPDRLQ